MKFILLLISVAITVNICLANNFKGLFRPSIASKRIIDGHDAVPNEAPFIVSLRTVFHFCGGSIINKHWVVTAGHCLFHDSFYIVAGLHNRNDESKAQIRHIKSKEYYIVHEEYRGGVGPKDIGLIYIAEPFKFGQTVNQINLPTTKYRHAGNGVLYGWGLDNSGSVPQILQVLNTTIVTYVPCKQALPRDAPLATSNICSYNKGQIASSCNGDSGGPLVKNSPSGVELIGIVSWGYVPCESTYYPSVYTHTSDYIKWIQKKIKKYKIPKE